METAKAAAVIVLLLIVAVTSTAETTEVTETTTAGVVAMEDVVVLVEDVHANKKCCLFRIPISGLLWLTIISVNPLRRGVRTKEHFARFYFNATKRASKGIGEVVQKLLRAS